MAYVKLVASSELKKKLDREYIETVSTATGLDPNKVLQAIDGKSVGFFFNNIDSLPFSTEEKIRLKAYKNSITYAKMSYQPEKEIKVSNAEDLAKIVMPTLSNEQVEHFQTAFISSSGAILDIKEISKGGLAQASIDPRDIFKEALSLNARNIILIHNHPSGDPEPSHDDVLFTRRIVDGGKLMGIDVADHIIIGKTYCSMRRTMPTMFKDANLQKDVTESQKSFSFEKMRNMQKTNSGPKMTL